jgi:hypothetical protein
VVIRHRPNGVNTPVHIAELQVFTALDGLEIELPINSGTLEASCPWAKALMLGSERGNVDDSDLTTFETTSGLSDSEFLKFNLYAEFLLSRIVVYNRLDCCQDRLTECDIEIRDKNDQLVWSAPFPTPARMIYIFVW